MPTALTRGPWDPRLQHGGPPSALLVRGIDEAHAEAGWRTARLTVEMRRPVPLAPVRVRVAAEHVGGRVARWRASLEDEGGRPLFEALAVRVREVETPGLSGHPAAPPPDPEGAPPLTLPHSEGHVGYQDLVDLRRGRGAWLAEPTLAWFRLRAPLVAGTPTSGLERVVVAADACSGVAAAVDWRRWSFVNAELTVHALRDPVDGWVGLDGRTDLSEAGVGLASAAILDRRGPIGRVAQALVLGPR